MDRSWGEQLGDVVDQARGRLAQVQQESTSGIDTGVLRDDVGRLQAVISAASAAQTVRLAQFAARDEERTAEGAWVEVDRGVGHVAEFRTDDVGPVLALSAGMAVRRVYTAAQLASKLPGTLGALARGVLDPFRAQIVAEETSLATRATCAAVEELVYPVDAEITPGALRRLVRRRLAQVEPGAVRDDGARARHELFVQVRASHVPGVSQWYAQLSAEDSVACWAAIDEAAHRAKAEDPGRSIDQCRAEAMADLILARTDIETTVHIGVPVHPHPEDHPTGAESHNAGDHAPESAPASEDAPTGGSALGGRELVGGDAFHRHASGTDVAGVGIITGQVLDRLLDRFGTAITGMLLDTTTGTTLATTSTAYRPPTRIRDLVRLRDGTCRFPGCATAATRCDLDHITPWPTSPYGARGAGDPGSPGGRTEPNNLIALCRHHHRLKTHARWSPTLDPLNATVTWTDPYGQQWLTRATDHLTPDVA